MSITVSLKTDACCSAAALTLAAFLLLAQIPAAHAATTWATPVNISPGDWPYESYDPQMAVDSNGVTHVVWEGDNGLDNILLCQQRRRQLVRTPLHNPGFSRLSLLQLRPPAGTRLQRAIPTCALVSLGA